MTLSGLTIFKLLPGGSKSKEANCKECGFPTCMAFAMKLAKGEASLEQCKYITDELKTLIETSGKKAQQELSFGLMTSPIKVGGESVLYRHEKSFINPTLLSIRVKTSDNTEKVSRTLELISEYAVDRVGEIKKIQSLTIENNNNDSQTFMNIIKILIDKDYNLALILKSPELSDLKHAVALLKKSQTPALFPVNAGVADIAQLFDETGCPIIISDSDINTLINTVQDLEKQNVTRLLLNITGEPHRNIIETLTLVRRSALLDNFKPLSYPVISFASDYCSTSNFIVEGLWAANLICKYSNIVVLDNFDPAIILTLFTLVQNLFTDPQKPLQIEPKLYAIGEVNEHSPVIVTTNFALTYFSVAGEIEASNIPCYLLITPSDGMSVLTAWAANKFSGEIIAKTVKQFNLESLIKHKELIISGYVSTLKEEIEEDLPGWNVHVAPMDASDIPAYLNEHFSLTRT